MAQQTTTYLKSRFETGDIPTQQDFEDLIDSVKHVDDGVKEETSPASIVIPANTFVRELFIKVGATGTLSVGSTNGGSEYAPALPVTSGEDLVLNVSIWANLIAKTVYFSGVAIEVYYREEKVKVLVTS